MAGPKKRSKGITAAELAAELEGDPEHQRKTEAAESERRARVREYRIAEQPIVAELLQAGVAVNSVWDLVNTSKPYPDALPVLLKHLQQGGYPDRVMEGLASALAVKPAAFAWDTLRELYLKAQGPGEEEGLAVALAESASDSRIDELIALLDEGTRGESRIHFLRAIKRVGGPRGRHVLESLKADPLYGKEARALLKSRS